MFPSPVPRMIAVVGISLIFFLMKDTASFVADNIIPYLLIKVFFIVVEEMYMDAYCMEYIPEIFSGSVFTKPHGILLSGEYKDLLPAVLQFIVLSGDLCDISPGIMVMVG